VFKVRCQLRAFFGNEEIFPCHFGYKIGDEFYYDGVYFTGRICPGLLASMMPVIYGTCMLGNKYSENIMFKYRGFDKRDASMAKYDGVGYCPLDAPPEGTPEKILKTLGPVPKTEKIKGGHFLCGDYRILADFTCQAVDLSDSEYAQPFYRRAIAVLDKIEAEPGIKAAEILDRFSDFERNKISPPLTPIFLQVLLEALTDMNYIKFRGKRIHSTGREPPSRPKIG
jgi:uncharacterized repeat protein (TIGR04076 family)